MEYLGSMKRPQTNSRYRAKLHVNLKGDVPLHFAGEVKAPMVRLLVQFNGTFRSVCKLLLPRSDLSFAIVPYSEENRYAYRLSTLGPGEIEKKIRCESRDFASVPKMSFHASGRVHLSVGSDRVGAVDIPRLTDWRGEHIATVDIDDLSLLPVHTRELKRAGDTLDQPIRFADDIKAGRFVFCVNAKEPTFSQPCLLVFEVSDGSGNIGLYMGIAPKHQPLRSSTGITVLGGWNPGGCEPSHEVNLLALRTI